MHVTFVAMGCENISLQALSACLKLRGHTTSLAYDQQLFDDRNYLFKPGIARLFSQKNAVLRQVLQSRPRLVGFSVMTATYRWALDMARSIKEMMDVPIIFGGIHASTLPEQVIANDCVDMLCVGEGDQALPELCDRLEAGQVPVDVRNIWLKHEGQIFRNEQRPVVADLDTLPMPDKELFAPHVPLHNYYLAVTSRGCPFTCSYCECSFQAEELKKLGAPRLRERSPDLVIQELDRMKRRYGFPWIDFRNNTFTASAKWVRQVCPRIKKEINLPYRIFGHPLTINDEIAGLLKETGCFSVQLGIESFDPRVRSEIMNRHESNPQILQAVEAMDRVGLKYSCDYILGVPTQTEEELENAAEFFARRKECYRVSSFMLAYQPRLKINQVGIERGDITQEEVAAMEKGEHNHYVATGSLGRDPRKLRFFMVYRTFFRMIPFLPRRLALFMRKKRLHKILAYLPLQPVLGALDILTAFIRRDQDALAYAKNYGWWFRKRFDPKHPAYWKNNRRLSGKAD